MITNMGQENQVKTVQVGGISVHNHYYVKMNLAFHAININ